MRLERISRSELWAVRFTFGCCWWVSVPLLRSTPWSRVVEPKAPQVLDLMLSCLIPLFCTFHTLGDMICFDVCGLWSSDDVFQSRADDKPALLLHARLHAVKP